MLVKGCLYLWTLKECLPVEVMRLGVRHAREGILLCCVLLIRHGDCDREGIEEWR